MWSIFSSESDVNALRKLLKLRVCDLVFLESDVKAKDEEAVEVQDTVSQIITLATPKLQQASLSLCEHF